MQRLVVRHWRRYRLGWLARNGYAIMIFGEDDIREWLARAAPKSRRKYRVATEAMFDREWMAQKCHSLLFDPRDLSAWLSRTRSDPASLRQIMATRSHRRDGDHDILLHHSLDLRGRRGWCGIPGRHSAMALDVFFWRMMDWVVPNIREEHAVRFERVVSAMGLDEVEHVRTFLDTTRRLLREPAATLAQRRKEMRRRRR